MSNYMDMSGSLSECHSRKGWACSGFLTSPLALDFQGSSRLRGLVYNEMLRTPQCRRFFQLPGHHADKLIVYSQVDVHPVCQTLSN